MTLGLPIHLQRAQMEREVAAFEVMHDSLVATYLNQYVAIHNGQVVDHDREQITLLRRVKAKLPNTVVMINQVLPALLPTLRGRSPRLL